MAKDTELSRRETILLFGNLAGASGLLIHSASSLLGAKPAKSAPVESRSIEDLTGEMLTTLSKATREDLKIIRTEYSGGDVSFAIETIVGQYHIHYWYGDCPNKSGIYMGVHMSRGLIKNSIYPTIWGSIPGWNWSGFGKLDGNTHVSMYDEKGKAKKIDRKDCGIALLNMTEILDINGHLQRNQSKDITSILDRLSQEIVSLNPSDFNSKTSTDNIYQCQGKNGDLIVPSFRFDPKHESVYITINSGKDELYMHHKKLKRGGMSIELAVNHTHFNLYDLNDILALAYPRKVYDRSAAKAIMVKAVEIKKTVTSAAMGKR